jgi:hypothetical protein
MMVWTSERQGHPWREASGGLGAALGTQKKNRAKGETTTKRQLRSASWLAVLGLAANFAMTDQASAHHPTISAVAACDATTGQLRINCTSTSWQTTAQPGSGNSQIAILVNNVQVAQGAYVGPTYSFSGSTPAPAGSSATVTAKADGSWDDGAAGGQSETIVVTYPAAACATPGTGRFTGGGFQLRAGDARVSRGLTIHCDLLLSNNLEVNWGGNRFHTTEHLQTVRCSDDPAIAQPPPAAPIDTLVGVGTGRYNNRDGFTILFTLVDGGEPGRSVDQAAIFIYETANPANVVLDVPLGAINGGNLQAHYDQPHR